MVLTPSVNLRLLLFLGDPQRNVELSQTPNYPPGDGETEGFHENAHLYPISPGSCEAARIWTVTFLDQIEFTLRNHCTFSSLFPPALELSTAVGFQSQCPTEKSCVLVSRLAMLLVLGID